MFIKLKTFYCNEVKKQFLIFYQKTNPNTIWVGGSMWEALPLRSRDDVWYPNTKPVPYRYIQYRYCHFPINLVPVIWYRYRFGTNSINVPKRQKVPVFTDTVTVDSVSVPIFHVFGTAILIPISSLSRSTIWGRSQVQPDVLSGKQILII